MKKIPCAVLVMASGSLAIAADVFGGGKPRAIKYGDPIASTDAVGSHAVYPGDGHWTFVSARLGMRGTTLGDWAPEVLTTREHQKSVLEKTVRLG